jgi:hypothetical protein
MKTSVPPDIGGGFIRLRSSTQRAAEREKEINLLKSQIKVLNESLKSANSRIAFLETSLASNPKETSPSEIISTEKNFDEKFPIFQRKYTELLKHSVKNEKSVAKETDKIIKKVGNPLLDEMSKSKAPCDGLEPISPKEERKVAKDGNFIPEQQIIKKGKFELEKLEKSCLFQQAVEVSQKPASEVNKPLIKNENQKRLTNALGKVLLPRDELTKKKISKAVKKPLTKKLVSKTHIIVKKETKKEKSVVKTGNLKIKFERKKKCVQAYTKDQLLALAKGEKIFTPTVYKVVKLINVKKMERAQIDQFCSKVLGFTAYSRSEPIYSDILKCYILYVNEKVLNTKIEKMNFNQEFIIQLPLAEVQANWSFFEVNASRIMKNEQSGNKPLFIAASLMKKACNGKSSSLLESLLINKGVSDLEMIEFIEDDRCPTPSYFTDSYERNEDVANNPPQKL